MTLISPKTIVTEIKSKSITHGSFAFYTFVAVGSVTNYTNFVQNTRSAFLTAISRIGTILILAITIYRYYQAYKISKGSEVTQFAYSVIPLTAVLSITYSLFIFLPLVIASVIIVYILPIDFFFWNTIALQTVTVVYSLLYTYNFIIAFKKCISNIIDLNA